MPTPRRKAFTLIEVLIASAIFLMMLTAIYQTLLLAIRHYHKIRDAAEIQGEALRVLNHVEGALSDAAAATVKINPNLLADIRDRYILFVSAEPPGVYFDADATDGKPKWQRIVCFYVVERASDKHLLLMRKDKMLPTPLSTALPGSLPTRDDMKNDPSLPTRILTDNLTEVAFGESTSIAFKLGVLSEKNNGLTVYTRVTPRL